MSRHSRSKPPPERSEQERERARDERARRRQREIPPGSDSPPPFVLSPPVSPQPAPAELATTPAPPLPDEAFSASTARPSGAIAPPPVRLAASPPSRVPRRSWRAVLVLVALAAVLGAVMGLFGTLRDAAHSGPGVAPAVVRILIPEGKTRAQIAQIANAAGLNGSYRAASARSALLSPVTYGAPRNTPTLEGFLFPATYDIDARAPASRLVDEQLIAFTENFGAAEIARARALHVTPYQLLTVASMVEREARVPADRAKIAAVIYNRLRLGMPLGIDATIYYAVEQRDGIATYTRELTDAQLHIDSPYNTRLHRGLPPTPISNPGLASIRAAAHPAHVAYLYYVLAADGCGEHVFSRNLAGFEADNAAYRTAVSRNGGSPPVCKRK